jgi:hypothetical protein
MVYFHNGLGWMETRSVELGYPESIEDWYAYQNELYGAINAGEATAEDWLLPGQLIHRAFANYREVFPDDPEWDTTVTTLANGRERDPVWFDMLLDDAAWVNAYTRNEMSGGLVHEDDSVTYPEYQFDTHPIEDRRYVVYYSPDEAGWVDFGKATPSAVQPTWIEEQLYHWEKRNIPPLAYYDIIFNPTDHSDGFYGQIERNGWFIYSTQTAFPWMYSFNEGAWVYFLGGGDDALWFYNANTGEYISN